MTRTWAVLSAVVVAAVVSGIALSPVNGLVIVVVAGVAWLVDLVLRRSVDMAWIIRASLSVVGALVLVQLIPYGRAHENPAISAEPVWDSVETRQLAVAACFDCHSNETKWPWYTAVAPASWITQRHIDEGRQKLNFSAWDREQEADKAAETVRDDEMPPRDYALIHPSARLTSDQKAALIAGLTATFGDEGGRNGDDDD